MRSLRLTLALAGAMLLAASAPALAEPARSTTLGPGAGTFSWEATGNGVVLISTIYDELGCSPLGDCDETLIKLERPGSLTVKTTSSDPVIDTDLTLWESDETGAAKKQIINAAGTDITSEEQTTQELLEGYYLVRIYYTVAVAGTVSGEATFTPDPAAAAAVAPAGAAPAAANNPPSAKLSTRSKVRSKSLKSIAGTASDDGSIARVDVGIVALGSKGRCSAMTSRGTFKSQRGCGQPKSLLRARGTTRWSLRLRRALKKGRYLVFVRATDDKGVATTVRGGFTVS